MLFLLPRELSEGQVIAASLPRWFLLQKLGCSRTEVLGARLHRFRLVIFLTVYPQKLSMKELCHACIPLPLPTPREKKAPEDPGEYRAMRGKGPGSLITHMGGPQPGFLQWLCGDRVTCLWKCLGLGALPTDTQYFSD